jgi:DnaK suppressor protein
MHALFFPGRPAAEQKQMAKRKTARKKTASRKKPARKAAKKPAAAARKTRAVAKKKPAPKVAAPKRPPLRPATTPPVRRPAVIVPLTPPGPRRIAADSPPTESASFTPYVQKRGEAYMNAAQVSHFRKILLDWKRSLMEEVDRTVHHMQDEASNFPDPNDRATQEEEFALELRTRDRERKLIKKIDESLADLEKGDYGFCEICGVEIGIKRLEARPTATLCIDCKTLDEIKEKQLG